MLLKIVLSIFANPPSTNIEDLAVGLNLFVTPIKSGAYILWWLGIAQKGSTSHDKFLPTNN